MEKFIYVFSLEKYDELTAKGFSFITADMNKNIFVFENKPEITLCFSKNDFVLSNTLTF